MMSSMPEFTIYFNKENGFVSMMIMVDLSENPFLTKDAIESVRQRAKWKFVDQGMSEIHALTLLLCDDMSKVDQLMIADPFFWIVDVTNQQLVVPEGKTEDFYGMRQKLGAWIMADDLVQDRGKVSDQYRADGKKVRSIWQQPLVNHTMFVINVLVFTFCTLTGELLYNYGRLSYLDIMNGEWYRMVTCLFLHASMAHLVSNMFMLFFMGNVVEKEMGHIPYFFLYMGSGLIGSAASMYMQYSQLMDGADVPGSIGASGALFGIMGGFLWVLLCNRGRASNMSLFRVLFLVVFCLYGGLQSTNVDNAAHFGGLIAGFILAIFLYRRPTNSEKKEMNYED